jgi:hypothetical protein
MSPAEKYIADAIRLLKMAQVSDSFTRLPAAIACSVREFTRAVRVEDPSQVPYNCHARMTCLGCGSNVYKWLLANKKSCSSCFTSPSI